jgi:hypothetical protein
MAITYKGEQIIRLSTIKNLSIATESTLIVYRLLNKKEIKN